MSTDYHATLFIGTLETKYHRELRREPVEVTITQCQNRHGHFRGATFCPECGQPMLPIIELVDETADFDEFYGDTILRHHWSRDTNEAYIGRSVASIYVKEGECVETDVLQITDMITAVTAALTEHGIDGPVGIHLLSSTS